MTTTYPNESHGVTDWHTSVNGDVRTDGCVFLLCTEGESAISVNLRKMRFRRGDLLVLTSDIHLMVREVSDRFSARFLSLSEAMIETAYYKITSKLLWDYIHYSAVCRLTAAQYRLVAGWMDQAAWLMENVTGGNLTAALNNCAYNLFIAIDAELARLCDNRLLERKDGTWELSLRFYSLVVKHSVTERSVAFYAGMMHITPGYLNRMCRHTFGMSPKALIDQQLTVQIKGLLIGTRQPVKAIAARLNFEDVSYLCRFFRRTTGMSPAEYRETARTAEDG